MASKSSALSASVKTPFVVGPATATATTPTSASSSSFTTITTTSSSSASSSSTSSTSPTPSTVIVSNTPAAAATPTVSAVIYPGDNKYQYSGCYNETTSINGTGGARALTGGSMESLESMTPEICLNFCGMDGYQYAGLEYAQECWCSQYISVFSAHLPDSECNLPCKGNTSDICGGSLKLTIYQAVPSKPSSRASGLKVGPTKLLIAGLAILGLVVEIW